MDLLPRLLVFATLIIPVSASADYRNLESAENYLSDALHAAREDSQRCRRIVIRDARDILDELSRRINLRRLTRIERDVEEMQRSASRVCSRRVRRNLEDASRTLRRAVRFAENRDCRPRGPAIECWNPKDQECFSTRNGQYPMQARPFSQLLKTFKRTTSDYSKQRLMKQIATTNYFTTAQLKVLLTTTTSDYTRGDMARSAARRIVDPKNAFVLRAATTSSYTADDMVRTVTKAGRGFKR